jgi:hypothetical protein
MLNPMSIMHPQPEREVNGWRNRECKPERIARLIAALDSGNMTEAAASLMKLLASLDENRSSRRQLKSWNP